MPTTVLQRGCVFGAEHDASYEFWRSSDPRWKRCLAFNVTPPSVADDVHYFIATSQVNFFRENPHLLSDVLIFEANVYSFFREETAINFRSLCVVPLAKLESKGLKMLGQISANDIHRCEATIKAARLLDNRAKRKLALLN